MLNKLRRVTSEGTSKVFKFLSLTQKGLQLTSGSVKTSLILYGSAVSTSLDNLVEIFH